ncbi:inositol phosphatase [Rahnella sp. SAP-1]|uniref:Inositol phosphatase n=1 Tax=Rouxiella aceris TaxID=2703884 RepID=A0A848MJ23_9GAMM|nr:inositol phosphate phosphatase SopB [Rouxiella aceris]NMP27131.1 inositol phosphatase [Rouxiella aceris]
MWSLINKSAHQSYNFSTELARPDAASSSAPILTKYEKSPPKADEIIKTSGENITPPPRSIAALGKMQTEMLITAGSVMDKLQLNAKSLLSLPGLLTISGSGDRQATQSEIKTVSRLKKTLIRHIAAQFDKKHKVVTKGIEKTIRQEFKDTAITLRNNKNWQSVQTHFVHNNKRYISTLVPAAAMKYSSCDMFETPYNNSGVCGSSTKNTKHATNLWTSEISVPEGKGRPRELFRGVRHGILSPYGLKKNDPARQAGALAQAKEVVTAALYTKPDLMLKALAGEPVSLQIVSTSLVTASQIGNEEDMLNDQMNAWQTLAKQTPLKLPVRVSNEEVKEIKVSLNVAAFNFGVNELALKFGLGWATSDRYNQQAVKQLLGDDLMSASPGGMVGEYLLNMPKNGQKVMELSQQFRKILLDKSYCHDNGTPYKAAQYAAMLAYEIGAVPCWNCKNGKDRTGMLDTELKREIVSQNQGEPLSQPGAPLNENNKQLFQKVKLHGGNQEVQSYNDGVADNKG